MAQVELEYDLQLEAQYNHWRELGIPVDDIIRWQENLSHLSDLKGSDWTESVSKRRLEKMFLALPSLGAEFIIPFLRLAVRLEDGEGSLYEQQRYLRDGSLGTIQKIRSLQVGSDPTPETSEYAASVPAWEDKRATRVGRQLRRFDLDELTQLRQIMLDPEFSFVGIRMTAPYAAEHMRENRPELYGEWWTAYQTAGAAVMGLNELFNSNTKDDLARMEYDIATAHFASPGLDAFVYAHAMQWYFRRLTSLGSKNVVSEMDSAVMSVAAELEQLGD